MKFFAMVDNASDTEHRPPLPVCVGCRTRLHGKRTGPGEIVVCLYRNQVQVFGDDLQFRGLTDQERLARISHIIRCIDNVRIPG